MGIEVVTQQTMPFHSNTLRQMQPNDTQKAFPVNDTQPKRDLNAVEKIHQMMEDIAEIKEKIDFELTVDNVMKYKRMISTFLKFYVENALKTHVISYRSKHGLLEKMTIVKKVEEGIMDLEKTMDLLETRNGHLETLKQIDEINGLIVQLKV